MIESVGLRLETIVMVKLTKAGKTRRDQLVTAGKCLGCERQLEEGEQVRCGQCTACYTASWRAIKAGKIKPEELIRQGKMLEKSKGGRKPMNEFTRELSEL